MLDITNYDNYISLYGGSEAKKTYYINGSKYLVKFPDPIRNKKSNVSYVNNQYSEYIGCKIFALFGIDVQEVELVKCNMGNKNKIAVMCKDFLKKDEQLIEFKNIAYSLNIEKKYTSELSDIFEMINNIDNLKEKKKFEDKFWRIFIVDTLIGNVDRHLGNWALIWNNNDFYLSPVYDCGSCLHPLLSEEEIEDIVKNKELKNISINLKTAYKRNGKTLNYIDIYENMPSKLKDVLLEMYHLIDMDKIKEIIYSIDTISDTMKYFYYNSILFRKKELIDKYYDLITK